MKQNRPHCLPTKHVALTSASYLMVGMSALCSQAAWAHGYMENPKARQAICKAQEGYWWPEDGSAIPNQACRDAYLQNGHVVFTQAIEFSANVSDFNNAAAVQEQVPDGLLCAAGSEQKSGADLPSSHWQKTQVTPDAAGYITVEFWASTPHNPSFWEFYLTRPEFDSATDVLRWEDLVLVQTHGNMDMVSNSDGRRYYVMDVAIPQGRSGDAILYTRWQRDDAAGEGFYNCSDITISADTQAPEWQSVGYYWEQGDTASEGDTVRVRLFSEIGTELIDLTLAVDANNSNSWAADLASQLNQNYASVVKVGVDDGAGNVAFDSANLVSNQVFTVNPQYSFDLTVTKNGALPLPLWDVDEIYVANDKVQFEGKSYRAKWWTKGDTPGNSQVWEAL